MSGIFLSKYVLNFEVQRSVNFKSFQMIKQKGKTPAVIASRKN